MMLDTSRHVFDWLDYTVVGIYFALLLSLGAYVSYRGEKNSVQGYFLASRTMGWIPVGASLFASNIGSGHFIGLAGSAAASGIGIAAFELNAIFILLLLGWIFVPVYISSGIYTMPEYIQLRFGGQRIRVYLATLTLLLYVFTKISADLYAGALFIQLAMGLEGDHGLYISMLLLLVIAAVFTIAGGITAVIWTETMQTVLMLVGAFILMGISFNAVGGYHELVRKYMELAGVGTNSTGFDVVSNVTCGSPPKDSMHLFRSIYPGESDLPWTGMVFGITVSSIWYWCADQVIVQRALAAKNVVHAKGGCILAGFLKMLPLYLLVFPGMAARVLFPERVACNSPKVCLSVCGSSTGCTNIAYAELVMRLMPTGLSGLMMAVMMAALLNSLTSTFNSTATIFAIDIWTRVRSNVGDREILIVSRASVIVLLGISVAWVPILKDLNASQLFVYIQQVSNFLSPPVAAVYLLAILYPRTNEQGAFWGSIVGLVLGVFRFILEVFNPSTPCGFDLDKRNVWIRILVDDIHYLHYGILLFLITLMVTFVVSLLTPPVQPERLNRLTFWTRHSKEMPGPRKISEQNQQVSRHPQASEQRTIASYSSKWTKLVDFVCCLGSTSATLQQESGVEITKEGNLKLLDEGVTGRRIVNGAAILLAVVAISVCVYYA